MTIDEAADFFSAYSKIHRTLSLMCDTGLGYPTGTSKILATEDRGPFPAWRRCSSVAELAPLLPRTYPGEKIATIHHRHPFRSPLQLGQPSPTVSGGEAQRIKLVTELTRGIGRSENARVRKNLSLKTAGTNLYLIEEPSIGLHMQDVRKLLEVLHRLVDDGHTVVVIEHNLDIIAEADYVVDIGPEAGPEGGEIVVDGTPEEVAQNKASRTGAFLKSEF